MPPAQLTPADLQTLARLAGLDITPEREPAVLTELNTQISNLLLIETILPAPNPAPTLPYDPTFPFVRGDEEPAQ
jgi:Asp-tRNA(Asn)/Glu-tRNA(Gln) amidotransferase C subunit